jgi:glycine cleavage system H protein
MQIPENLRFTKDHEWVRPNGDAATVGITDYAQDALGDIVFVQLPEVGRSVIVGDVLCEVESTKSVSEVYAPIAGTIAEINQSLSTSPELINKSCYEDGWICKITPSDAKSIEALLSATDYRGLTE